MGSLTQQKGHEQVEEPLSAYAIVRLKPSSSSVQLSLLCGGLGRPSWLQHSLFRIYSTAGTLSTPFVTIPLLETGHLQVCRWITSKREDRHVTRMDLMDRAVMSRALSQELESFAKQQVSARTVRRRLLNIDGTLNSARYISGVLRPVALPFILVQRNPTIKQDNARLHVAGIVRKFLDTENVRLLPWHARSPDLSPIENVQSMVAE
ncbi:uncharacterized protein TNCV_2069681 [Trichonephila clavipes]|uniref:Transposase n=1 Tax=Trichonephila clavipes TaxID=2585209 RepID=A0A8X7BDE4_TRICX|nr:uncharacterized protein TNCV_2069681 [Trichonephila clavipes]